MVEMKVETTEPDPSATSLVNDNIVNTATAATKEPVLGEFTSAEDRKATEQAKEIIEEIKAEKKGETSTNTHQAGESNGTATESNVKKETSDSSKVGPTTDNGSQIKQETNGETKSSTKTAAPGGENTGDRGAGSKRGGYQGVKRFEDYRKNVKTDFTAQRESSDPDEIRKQVNILTYQSLLRFD